MTETLLLEGRTLISDGREEEGIVHAGGDNRGGGAAKDVAASNVANQIDFIIASDYIFSISAALMNHNVGTAGVLMGTRLQALPPRDSPGNRLAGTPGMQERLVALSPVKRSSSTPPSQPKDRGASALTTLGRLSAFWGGRAGRGVDSLRDIIYNITVRPGKLLDKARRSPAGLRFSELCKLAEAFGFVFQRQKGSHKIYSNDHIRQMLNFQDDHGKAKAYQVRQLLDCADRNQLRVGGADND